MYKYIEIISYDNDEVVKRIDVTKHSERSIDKIESGANINLNHDGFFTQVKEYDSPQE